MISDNFIAVNADGYKYSHPRQYPPHTLFAKSYFEARSPYILEEGLIDETVFFGMQYYLKKYLSQRVTHEMIDEAEEFVLRQGAPFYKKEWETIADTFDGRLPVRIHAVPEGLVVPHGNVLFTVENTVGGFHWLPSFLETLLVKLWYPITVASYVRNINSIFYNYSNTTSDLPPLVTIGYKLTDFGLRGVSSDETGGIGGAALFAAGQKFSDNQMGIGFIQDYYGTRLGGTTIPAMEHSTVTSWGRAHELDAFKNHLDHYLKPGAYVAMVMDSYDLVHAINMVAESEIDRIKNSGGTVVFRPDSGYPPKIVVEVLEILASKFGYETNSKGYKVLPPYVRVIQGDGIDADMIVDILDEMEEHKFSIDNIIFGSGGALLQKHNRDNFSFAYKTCQIGILNEESGDFEFRSVKKEPKTDMGKKSKGGDLILVRDSIGKFNTIDRRTIASGDVPVLEVVYENGEITSEYTLDEIVERSMVNL